MLDILKNLLMLCHDKILGQINPELLTDKNIFVNLKLHAK